MAFLQIQNITKTYGDLTIFKDFSLSMESGDRLVLIGPSGCGKSTLLRCLMGLETIKQGDISFDNKPYIDAQNNKRKVNRIVQKRIGMVFQHYTLFPHFSILGNLCLSPVTTGRMKKAQAKEKAEQLLTRFGLIDRINYYPSQLSGGQKQRVAIARALMLDPELMLFDEVTSALDPELVVEVETSMIELAKAGMPMVIVTHDMHFARSIASKVSFLEKGQVIESGAPEVIFNNPQQERTRSFLKNIFRFEGGHI